MLTAVLEGSGNRVKKDSEDKENIKKKDGFIKKVWCSIYKIEKYAELSAEGFGKAIRYLSILVMIVAIISALISCYKTNTEIKNVAKYINENAPELNYKDDVLQVDSEETITYENSDLGKIIIDTKTDSEEQINKYINEINNENGIIVLKNKFIVKEKGLQGTVDYEYKQLVQELGITEFNKQQLVEYLTGSNMKNVYINLFIAFFVYTFVVYYINVLCYIMIITLVGYLAAMILKLKIRFVAIFNMSVYAITLPTILYMIYLIVNAIFNYQINYFDIMYTLVASIYVIAAIFMLKSEFNKKQGQVQKIVEVEKEVKEEQEKEEKKQEEDKKENKRDDNQEDKKEETDEDNTNGEEPEGSNA